MLSIEDFARLGQVSVRMLRHYDAIVLKQLDPVRVATVRATVSGVEEIGSVVGPCFERLVSTLSQAGTPPVPPSIAFYELPAEGALTRTAGSPSSSSPSRPEPAPSNR
jgi:hypothetical protein